MNSFQIVQAIVHWPERGLVVLAICRDVASVRILDCRPVCRQRYDRSALKQPNEANSVVVAQAIKTRERVLGDLDEPE